MGNADHKVWLATVSVGPNELSPPGSATSGHRLYSTKVRASEGLRDIFADMLGIDDDVTVEAIVATQVEDEIDTYHGSYRLEDRFVSFLVVPLPVDG